MGETEVIKDLFNKQANINKRYENMFAKQIELNNTILDNQDKIMEYQKSINDEIFKQIAYIIKRIEGGEVNE